MHISGLNFFDFWLWMFLILLSVNSESRLPVDVSGHRSSHRLTGTTPVHDESQLRTEYSSNYTIEADDRYYPNEFSWPMLYCKIANE